jgi:hypothetical protein
MIRKALGLVLFGGALVSVACSTEVVADKYPTVDSFCDAKAAAECKVAGPQCGVDDNACKTARGTACRSAAAAAVGRVYKPSLAEDCLNKTTAVYQDRTIDPTKEAAYTDACEKVFAGTKKDLEPCTSLYECENFCDVVKGFCGVKKEVAANAQCNNAGEICPKGSYCQLKGALRFCGDKKKVDEQCAADAPCLEDLRCLAGKCAPKVGPAGACDTKDDCTSGACDPTTKKCVSKQFESETSSCKDFGGA